MDYGREFIAQLTKYTFISVINRTRLRVLVNMNRMSDCWGNTNKLLID